MSYSAIRSGLCIFLYNQRKERESKKHTAKKERARVTGSAQQHSEQTETTQEKVLEKKITIKPLLSIDPFGVEVAKNFTVKIDKNRRVK